MNAFNTLPTLEVVNPSNLKGSNLISGAHIGVQKETKKFFIIAECFTNGLRIDRKVSKETLSEGKTTFALVATQKAQEPVQATQAPQPTQERPPTIVKALLSACIIWNEGEAQNASDVEWNGLLERLAFFTIDENKETNQRILENAKLHAVHSDGQEFDSDNEALEFLNDKVSEIQGTLDDLRGTVENYNKENEEGRNTIADLQDWLNEARRADALGFEAPPMWKLFDLIEALPELATIEE